MNETPMPLISSDLERQRKKVATRNRQELTDKAFPLLSLVAGFLFRCIYFKHQLPTG